MPLVAPPHERALELGRASSSEDFSASTRPWNGEIVQPSRPSNAAICVRPCSVISLRIMPGRLSTWPHGASMLRPRPPNTTRPVNRSVLISRSFASPPRALRFLARISSRVAARLVPASDITITVAIVMRFRMRRIVRSHLRRGNSLVPLLAIARPPDRWGAVGPGAPVASRTPTHLFRGDPNFRCAGCASFTCLING
jgi:hypothetical protein